jgi:dephospho-CoA kinase
LVIGLTGGVASGKSAAADEFTRLGVIVVDTDLLAREVVAPGQPALLQIVQEFGTQVLGMDGALDRRRLREQVFADPAARLQLEAITHPRIRELARTRLQGLSQPYAVLVIPLLAEKGRYDFIDRVLLVDVDPQVQLQRVQTRDAISAELARAMLDAQATREQRLAIADDVIDNSADLAHLYAQVAAMHQRYLDLAASRLAR